MEKLKLFIQMFAEDDEQPTEEVEDSTEEVEEEVEDTPEDDVDFDDTEAELKEEVKEEPKPKKNTKAENMRNAQLRIQKKQRERENEIARQTKLETLKKLSGGVNKFTGEDIVDEEDLEEFEIMLELESKGKDVLEEYPKYIKEQKRKARMEASKANEEKERAERDIQNDLQDFTEKYGDGVADKLLQDNDFIEFADDLLGKVSLAIIYERYNKQQELINKKAEDNLIKKEARRRSSPGLPGKQKEGPTSLDDMTPEEFHRYSLEIANRY